MDFLAVPVGPETASGQREATVRQPREHASG